MMLATAVFSFSSCENVVQSEMNPENSTKLEINPENEVATLGAGCFWCTEAVFEQLNGVKNVESGFATGRDKSVGQAEVCQIIYDPEVISFEELLEIYWQMHDPTTPDRQGADVGPEYRSVIFFHDDKQKKLALHYKQKLTEAKAFDAPIVTEVSEFGEFKPASDAHQNYYRKNKTNQHCQLVIQPKIEKIKKAFADKVKK